MACVFAQPSVASAASGVQGTVTGPLGQPLGEICVTAGGEAGFDSATTGAGGTYSIELPPASDYIVYFDDCAAGIHSPEYFDDATQFDDAEQVAVAPDAFTPAIDAQLAPAPPDDTPPETTIDSGPGGTETNPVVTFEFSADEPVLRFECSLDSGAFEECESPLQAGPLADGPHTFAVQAVDLAGNIDPTPATREFTIDATAPDTSIDDGPSGTITTRNVEFTFSSTKNPASFICRLDDDSPVPCSSPRSYEDLADGSHTFSVFATDSSGNADGTPATRTFTVDPGGGSDTTPPETTIASGPSGTINSTTTTFTFSSSESGTFRCKLDAEAFTPCTSPRILVGLSQGSHDFFVKATDLAGNEDASPAERNFAVDSIAPETSIDSGPTGTVDTGTVSFAFSSSEDPSTFACRLDTGGFSPCSSPREYSGLSNGPHTFMVRATDGAGNTDLAPATQAFVVDVASSDTTPPDTTITSGPTGTITTSSASFGFGSTESGSSFECRLDSGSFSDCSSPKAHSGLADGAHTFYVRATDAAGNPDASPASRSFTVDTSPPPDTTPPETTIVSGPSGTIGSSSASFGFASSEAGSTFECSLDGQAFAGCGTPRDYAALSDGAHTFAVRAIDVAGNLDVTPATRSFTVETAVDPPPPPPPPPPSTADCDAAKSSLASAQKAMTKAKGKVKKAKGSAAKKKAKAKLKSAKSKLKAAQASVDGSCG